MTNLRLSIEPIPEGSRFASLANLLPPPQWDRIRRSVYQRAGYRCQICGSEGRLHCHEVWGLNTQTGCQWLCGFEALCRDCHDVRHVFFARDDARRAELLRHFISVNRLTPEEAHEHLRAAAERQRKLNQRAWKVDYGGYNGSMAPLANQQQRREYAAFLRPGRRSRPQPQPYAVAFAAEPMTD